MKWTICWNSSVSIGTFKNGIGAFQLDTSKSLTLALV